MDATLPISPDWKEEVEEFAKNGLQALNPEDAFTIQRPDPPEDLTEDDPQLFYYGQLFPLLAQHRLPAPIYDQFFEIFEQIRVGECRLMYRWTLLKTMLLMENQDALWKIFMVTWMTKRAREDMALEESELEVIGMIMTNRTVSQAEKEALEELEKELR
ncbi:MAG: hypothetical protein Q9225_003260 [Loekoesia sp. 1 TL-2023]